MSSPSSSKSPSLPIPARGPIRAPLSGYNLRRLPKRKSLYGKPKSLSRSKSRSLSRSKSRSKTTKNKMNKSKPNTTKYTRKSTPPRGPIRAPLSRHNLRRLSKK